MKFERTYKLTIGTNDGLGDIIIEPPLTIIFEAVRNSSGAAATLQLAIYNLAYSTRRRIFQDGYVSFDYKPIKLEAGYGGNLSTIFQGNYTNASSVREGDNIVTHITSMDGGWDTINVKTYTTLAAGANAKDITTRLAGDFQHVKLGKISTIQEQQSFGRGLVLEGNTWDLIRTYTNNSAFIDLETFNSLAPNDAIQGAIPLIDASSGLLSTPRREGGLVNLTTLLEPGLVLGQILQVNSSVQPEFNGQYKVQSIKHTGTISEAVNGRVTTQLALWKPTGNNQNFTIIK